MNAFEIYLGAFRSREATKNVREADGTLDSMKALHLAKESSGKSGEILSELLHIFYKLYKDFMSSIYFLTFLSSILIVAGDRMPS
ncbi:MAG: hypothetical protein AOA65_0610 [Candidatus Bathyarchaeota archaeon BA1]|nr:MAG: hypothetical protein AOA65_0610 [Candidatus Bathyarchaeota archaeon BA1]